MDEPLDQLGQAIVSALGGAATGHALAHGQLTLSAQAGDELVEPPGDLQVALGRLRGVPFGERPTDRAHRHQDGGKGRRDE